MKIRFKILSGFLLLVAMLIVAGGLSIIEFSKISRSVQDLLEDNYKSIEASKSMLEALEREDSGVLLLLHGNWEQGRTTIDHGDSLFIHSFRIARNNITEPNESALIDSIDYLYRDYKTIWERPIVGTPKEENLEWYYNTSHASFTKVKQAVKELMSLNQNSMYKEATNMREKARRAIMPGIVAILSAFVFSFLFNYFINRYFITPLDELISRIDRFSPDADRIETDLQTRDELKHLQDAVNDLISKLKFRK
jgi:methyl-accepting chemotaxis protein